MKLLPSGPTDLSLFNLEQPRSDKLVKEILAASCQLQKENNKKRDINLKHLMELTKFSKQEIMKMYRGFKQVCLVTLILTENYVKLLGMSHRDSL